MLLPTTAILPHAKNHNVQRCDTGKPQIRAGMTRFRRGFAASLVTEAVSHTLWEDVADETAAAAAGFPPGGAERRAAARSTSPTSTNVS